MSFVPHTDADRARLLAAIGVESIDELFADIPASVRIGGLLNLPPAADEIALTRELADLAALNSHSGELLSFLGAGLYDHYRPPIVDALAGRSEFATSYTPYQPEASQGMLQAVYEYQTLVCQLTGMEMANASMYDASTALAEAALMAVEITGRKRVIVPDTVHPQYRRVLQTYLRTSGFEMQTVEEHVNGVSGPALLDAITSDVACVVVQSPNFLGAVESIESASSAAHACGALCVAVVDPISLGLLKPPGELGADVVVGEGQGLGCPMGFGGPLLGFFAFRSEYQRRFPGRIVGATVDRNGKRAYTMTLRTREQDIRRERATSNICTNEALMALAATIYLCHAGPKGLREIANSCLQKSHYAAGVLAKVPGVATRFSGPFFKEFVLRLPSGSQPGVVTRRLLDLGILPGYELGQTYQGLSDCLLVCVTEMRSRAEIDRLADSLGEVLEVQS